jgi:hypothetical protein
MSVDSAAEAALLVRGLAQLARGSARGRSVPDATTDRLVAFATKVIDAASAASEPDWDAANGNPVDDDATAVAVALYGTLVVLHPDVPEPVVSPCGDGSLHLRWALSDGRTATAEAFGTGPMVLSLGSPPAANRIIETMAFDEAAAAIAQWLGTARAA